MKLLLLAVAILTYAQNLIAHEGQFKCTQPVSKSIPPEARNGNNSVEKGMFRLRGQGSFLYDLRYERRSDGLWYVQPFGVGHQLWAKQLMAYRSMKAIPPSDLLVNNMSDYFEDSTTP